MSSSRALLLSNDRSEHSEHSDIDGGWDASFPNEKVQFKYGGMVNLLEMLRQSTELHLAASTTMLAHLPLIRNPTEPSLLA